MVPDTPDTQDAQKIQLNKVVLDDNIDSTSTIGSVGAQTIDNNKDSDHLEETTGLDNIEIAETKTLEQLSLQNNLINKLVEEKLVDLTSNFLNLQNSQFNSQVHLPKTGFNFYSFTQGLLLGQLSVIIVLLLFIKFFIFSDSIPKKNSSQVNERSSINFLSLTNKRKQQQTNEQNSNTLSLKIASILEKTYYDVNSHPTESLDWFNVLVAQIISQFRDEALLSNNLINSFDEILSDKSSSNALPDWLDKIKITEIDIGDDYPIFSNCRILEKPNKNLEAKIDVDLSDTLTLGIETKLLVNKPKFMSAVLPIALSVSIVRFSGCLSVSLISTSDDEFLKLYNQRKSEKDKKDKTEFTGGAALMFFFSQDYRLEFQIKSLIGSRSKLENVPKIGYLIEEKLRGWFIERCVEPRFQLIPLPSLWPSKQNVRVPANSSTPTNTNNPT
ncbi:ERMES complex subunit MMM1 ASCRUDRAFT_137002 [Ascoidea rubescens DSM 1968]|uniref:Maintenance of mitochondrial morphology protein 1 n=1 Tax=Ascoidea rubescens DSM 1968 TaxID=1344418 RepID=A0A1D2VM74_9ASCO|nr:hypothetical protein ASCRUDRAFT_137002 [Ascoidea rubescens DSM 1968]ODV62655.1 hypothetical protein ASCRUDRAFT_137002 [Ascoidea rubescens DSM 1968]